MKSFGWKHGILALLVGLSLVWVPGSTEASIAIPVGDTPFYLVAVGTDVYVLNFNLVGSISVIDTTTNTVTDTITVGSLPNYALLAGTDLYVVNNGSDDISVIDTTTNTVTDTIPVGDTPYFAALVGTDVYVPNYVSGNISVIDTTTNTVTDTISMSGNPQFPMLVGDYLYVANPTQDAVSVIDTTTNTVTDTIPVGTLPYKTVLVGSDLYVNNFNSSDVSVIDTTTNTVTDTITVGNTPFYSTVAGTDLYVVSIGSSDVSVIDTTTNTVTHTIPVGNTPFHSTVVGTNVYVSNLGSDNISVIDTTTKNVTDTVMVGDQPRSLMSVGTYLYVGNSGSSTVSVMDTNTNLVIIVPPPVIVSATVDKSTLVLTYDEPLDTGSVPAAGDFVVLADSAPINVSGVDVSGYVVTLTLESEVEGDDFVSIDYNTGDNPIQDMVGYDAASLNDQYVTVHNTYNIAYNAGANGLVNGTSLVMQIVDYGTSGPVVTAEPDPGYYFVDWSDASFDNPRTDAFVTSTFSVTANFAFGVAPVAPTVVTDPESSVGQTSATLNGTISDIGSGEVTDRGFNIGTDTNYGMSDVQESGSFEAGSFSLSATGLTCNTTYHFRAFATNGAGTDYGDDDQFTTSSCGGGGGPTATVVNTSASAITKTSATFGGNITDTGGDPVESRGMYYVKVEKWNGGIPAPQDVGNINETGAFEIGEYSLSASDLSCGTDYYYLSYALQDGGGVGIAFPPASFTTSSCSGSQGSSTGSNSVGKLSGFVFPQVFGAPTTISQTAVIRTLRIGMKGDDVVWVQRYLGVTPIPSKLFGPKTKRAVQAFQKAHGLKADGVVGPKTKALMK